MEKKHHIVFQKWRANHTTQAAIHTVSDVYFHALEDSVRSCSEFVPIVIGSSVRERGEWQRTSVNKTGSSLERVADCCRVRKRGYVLREVELLENYKYHENCIYGINDVNSVEEVPQNAPLT